MTTPIRSWLDNAILEQPKGVSFDFHFEGRPCLAAPALN